MLFLWRMSKRNRSVMFSNEPTLISDVQKNISLFYKRCLEAVVYCQSSMWLLRSSLQPTIARNIHRLIGKHFLAKDKTSLSINRFWLVEMLFSHWHLILWCSLSLHTHTMIIKETFSSSLTQVYSIKLWFTISQRCFRLIFNSLI